MYNYLFIFFWVFARGFFFMPKTNPSADVKERKNLGYNRVKNKTKWDKH